MNVFYQMTSKKRLTALLVLAAILVFMLFSSRYIVREADHDCSGAACPICASIEQCEDTLRKIGAGQIPMLAAAAEICVFLHVVCFAVSAGATETLITRKVRLNH